MRIIAWTVFIFALTVACIACHLLRNNVSEDLKCAVCNDHDIESQVSYWDMVFDIDKQILSKTDNLSEEAKKAVLTQLISMLFVPAADFWGCSEHCLCEHFAELVCSRERTQEFKKTLSSTNIGEDFISYRENMAAYREGYLLGWLFELKRFSEKEIFKNEMNFSEGQDYDAYCAWVMSSVVATRSYYDLVWTRLL